MIGGLGKSTAFAAELEGGVELASARADPFCCWQEQISRARQTVIMIFVFINHFPLAPNLSKSRANVGSDQNN